MQINKHVISTTLTTQNQANTTSNTTSGLSGVSYSMVYTGFYIGEYFEVDLKNLGKAKLLIYLNLESMLLLSKY